MSAKMRIPILPAQKIFVQEAINNNKFIFIHQTSIGYFSMSLYLKLI